MKILVKMRKEAGFPFRINSGYRCPDYNEQVSSSGREGPHTLGLAADIAASGKQALEIVRVGIKYGIQGFGISQRGGFQNRFIHVDSVKPGGAYPRKTIWSY